MKKIQLTIILLFISLFCFSQNFEVFHYSTFHKKSKEIRRYKIFFVDTVDGEKRKVTFFEDKYIYKCEPNPCEEVIFIVRDTLIHRQVDTLKLIEELLKFEGDNRKSSLQYTKYSNPENVSIDRFFDKISLQVQALFMIDYIIFSKNDNNFMPLF